MMKKSSLPPTAIMDFGYVKITINYLILTSLPSMKQAKSAIGGIYQALIQSF